MTKSNDILIVASTKKIVKKNIKNSVKIKFQNTIYKINTIIIIRSAIAGFEPTTTIKKIVALIFKLYRITGKE